MTKFISGATKLTYMGAALCRFDKCFDNGAYGKRIARSAHADENCAAAAELFALMVVPQSQKEDWEMFRTAVLIAALTPFLGAQTAPVTAVPLTVGATVSNIDSSQWIGAPDGPALFLTFLNTSPRAVNGFAFETTFFDPQTGSRVGPHESGCGYAQATATAPGALVRWRPEVLPKTPSGLSPAYSVRVDAVVFDDGSTWGPGTTRGGHNLLSQMSCRPPKRGRGSR